MQDRIQIDGVWYVREQQEPEVKIDIIRSESRTIESDKYCFDAVRLERSDAPGTYYDGIDVRFTDKRERPWKEDHWDNDAWMRGVLINDPESLGHLKESVCSQGEAEFKTFLKALKEEGWL